MAIQSSFAMPTGAQGNYWRIVSLNINPVDLFIDITLSLWLDSTSAQNGLSYLMQKRYRIVGDDYSTIVASQDLTSATEIYLLTLPDFSGGTQVA